uniref:Uncharacterized protein n=1 Tax=Oryza rufipogon TaxID=4529 RepID=A0A0E0NKS6_ORYRU
KPEGKNDYGPQKAEGRAKTLRRSLQGGGESPQGNTSKEETAPAGVDIADPGRLSRAFAPGLTQKCRTSKKRGESTRQHLQGGNSTDRRRYCRSRTTKQGFCPWTHSKVQDLQEPAPTRPKSPNYRQTRPTPRTNKLLKHRKSTARSVSK